jgi:hypothetical protein
VYSSSVTQTANRLHFRFTLSHFRGLFNDHTRPIIFYQLHSSCGLSAIYSVDNVTDTFVFPEWIIHTSKNVSGLFLISFTKLRRIFWYSKFFFHFFFWELYLNRYLPHLFYKVKNNFSKFQIFLSLFLRFCIWIVVGLKCFTKVMKKSVLSIPSDKFFFDL